jgi:hypothetical protein
MLLDGNDFKATDLKQTIRILQSVDYLEEDAFRGVRFINFCR